MSFTGPPLGALEDEAEARRFADEAVARALRDREDDHHGVTPEDIFPTKRPRRKIQLSTVVTSIAMCAAAVIVVPRLLHGNTPEMHNPPSYVPTVKFEDFHLSTLDESAIAPADLTVTIDRFGVCSFDQPSIALATGTSVVIDPQGNDIDVVGRYWKDEDGQAVPGDPIDLTFKNPRLDAQGRNGSSRLLLNVSSPQHALVGCRTKGTVQGLKQGPVTEVKVTGRVR